MKDLKQRTIRGGVARMFAQAANFLIGIVSLMVLARLLGPKDFGLVGMVTAFTGVLGMFRDFGLSSASVQRVNVTEEQMSTLFWINLGTGGLLGLLIAAMAPAIAAFYHEPRLFAVTLVLAAGFILNSAGVQHGAILQRHMRFTALAVINTVSAIVGTAIAIGGAKAGYGYWALVAMAVASPLTSTILVWLTTAWVPGMPHRRTGIRSMMHYGGTLTLYGLIGYVATNLQNVLLGRFWGADAIGIYGRAYRLVNIPTESLNGVVGEVAFPALARIQDDPSRLKSYFLKGYSLVLALTLPITVACTLFVDDVIYVLLGPKWKAAAVILRLLAPTILVFAITNPLGWLLSSIGRVGRLLKMNLVIAPLLVLSYTMGLRYGPRGVAFAYSAVLTLWVLPDIAWAVQGTVISFWDVLRTLSRPLASSIVAGGLAFGIRLACGQSLSPLPRLALECAVLLVTFSAMLLFVTGQKSLYLDLLRGLIRHSSAKEKVFVSA
jgi:O-antigen/teichoic acid export membrane protein